MLLGFKYKSDITNPIIVDTCLVAKAPVQYERKAELTGDSSTHVLF
jgi:hypothetical protein